mgnify:CR=1 FL=1
MQCMSFKERDNLHGLQVDNYESNSKDAGDGHDVGAGSIPDQSSKSLLTRLFCTHWPVSVTYNKMKLKLENRK